MRGKAWSVVALWLASLALGGVSPWVTREAPLWDLTEGAGKRVAVGSGGLVLVSQGTSAWRPVRLGSHEDLQAVAFGGGRFVAVGEGKVHVSANGEVWKSHPLLSEAPLSDVVHGKAGFLVGGHGGLWFSLTGERWEKVYRRSVRFLLQGGGTYLAFGEKEVAVSQDGRTWRRAPLPEEFTCAAHAGRAYLALGENLYLSADGLSWRPLRSRGSRPFCPLASYGGRFYALGGEAGGPQRILGSTDGNVWRLLPWPPLPDRVSAPLKLWVGPEGAWLLDGDPMTGGQELWQLRGGRWTQSFRLSLWAYSLVYAQGLFVGTGPYGGGYWSRDGLIWQSVTIDPELRHLGNVVHGPQGFLTYDIMNRIYRSADGRTWRAVGEISDPPGIQILRLEAGSEGYLAYVETPNGEALLFSRDGRSWVPFREHRGPEDVALGERVRLALWEGVVHRLEGGRWQPIPDPQESPFAHKEAFRPRALAYGRGVFAALTLGGEVLFSRDGREWRQVWGLPSLEGMDLVFGAGRFVAVGVDRGVAVLATSP